jgi:hypothetical protein
MNTSDQNPQETVEARALASQDVQIVINSSSFIATETLLALNKSFKGHTVDIKDTEAFSYIPNDDSKQEVEAIYRRTTFKGEGFGHTFVRYLCATKDKLVCAFNTLGLFKDTFKKIQARNKALAQLTVKKNKSN